MSSRRDDAFRRAARTVVGLVKEGRHAEASERLTSFLELRQGSWEHANKKAHVLAGMAYDAIRQGELAWAERYLTLHREDLADHLLLPTIVDEGRSVASLLRHVSRGVPLEACPRVPRARKVAFLCPDNAVLSPMAEALARHRGGPDLHAISGGLRPAGRIPDGVRQVLDEVDVPPPREETHEVPREVLRRYPLVVGLGVHRADALGDAPRARFLEWDLAPPATDDLAALRRIRDALRAAVEDLLDAQRLRTPPGTEE